MAVSIHGNNGVITTNGTAAAPSFAAPDSDTGLYFGTNLIHATTNGTNRFNIDANGNVGIGTTAPESKLHVKAGNVKVDNTGNPFFGTRFNAGADGAVLFLQHSRSGTIGTKVKLNDNDEVGAIQFRAYASDNTNIKNSGYIKSEVNGTPTANGVPADLIFGTGSTSGNATEKLRISSSGQILINRTAQHASSSERLSVNGLTSIQFNSTSSAGLYIFNEDTTGSGAIQPHIFCHDGSGIRTGLGVQRSTGLSILNGQFGLSFRTGASGVSGTERLIIQTDGKIGINDSTPSVTLETVGHNQVTFGSMPETIITYGTTSAYNSGSAGSGIQFGGNYNTTPEHTIFAGVHGVKENTTNAHYSGALVFSTRANNGNSAERVRITSAGLVGINKTDPDGKGIDVLHSRTNAYGTTNDQRGLAHIIARNGSDAPDRFASISLVSGGGTQAEGSINLVQTGNYIGDLTFKSRTAATTWTEKMRITSGGQIRLPINGQEIAMGASQQFRMYWENSEERAYLQGAGAYGLAFRVNGGNRIEISKTTGDVVMQGASGRNFQWDNSDASLYLTDNGSGASARLKIGSGSDLQMYHDTSGLNLITCANNHDLKVSTKTLQVYDYTGVTKKFETTNRGKVLSYHADTAEYGASDWARTGSGNQGNASQAHPEGSIQFQSNTGYGTMKCKSYIQSTDPDESDMYITLANSAFYRITIKGSANSQSANVAMYLVYGLNNMSARIEEVANSGSFSATTQNTHVNSHDTTLKISYSGGLNQGMRALVEVIGGF